MVSIGLYNYYYVQGVLGEERAVMSRPMWLTNDNQVQCKSNYAQVNVHKVDSYYVDIDAELRTIAYV